MFLHDSKKNYSSIRCVNGPLVGIIMNHAKVSLDECIIFWRNTLCGLRLSLLILNKRELNRMVGLSRVLEIQSEQFYIDLLYF